ncbi:MAG: selenocysteine lyase/cysteine desulfurase, partial [Candidatus Promineifilaceae bacterium]
MNVKPDFEKIRADFPRAARKTWLAGAEYCPLSVHSIKAIEAYTAAKSQAFGGYGFGFTSELQAETKERFANLINASADEIAFVQSTTDGENIVLEGLGLTQRGGNVVIDDLHFEASKYLYTSLQEQGLIELRIIEAKDWQTTAADYAKHIDKNTQLVSIALVSQINGYVADVKAISDLAHDQGAWLFADIIQGAGNTPIDVQAMGIDFASSSTYKWLMGEHGFGFLYIRRDLQEEVVKPTRHGLRRVKSEKDFQFVPHSGAAIYEGTSSMGFLPGVIAATGLKYMTELGVEAIRAHARPLIDRLQSELPGLGSGYRPISPIGNPSSIVSFLPKGDIEETQAKLDKAFGEQV